MENIGNEEGRDEETGRFKTGHPGFKPVGAISKATRFKNLIYEAIEDRKDELTAKDILELAKIAAKFVPKEHNIRGEFEHTGFIENMIKKAHGLKEEQDGNKDQD
jgi:hypothetical protein